MSGAAYSERLASGASVLESMDEGSHVSTGDRSLWEAQTVLLATSVSQPDIGLPSGALVAQWIKGSAKALLVIAIWAALVWLATSVIFEGSQARAVPETAPPGSSHPLDHAYV